MITLIQNGVYLLDGKTIAETYPMPKEKAAENTIAYGILKSHNGSGDTENLKIKFDAMASHDITYVGIIQTARASGLSSFPMPYVLTNCHNSLCAVGGTINEDDHVFGLSAAKKYGGIFVPAHQAVIHSYMRENYAACGKMILGSDSHTRYGALGTLAVGEGGPELVKQLLGRTYDIARPDVIAVYLEGSTKPGIGPHDVAIALIGAVFKSGFVKNKILEFVGPGVKNLPIEFRNGIDVMTTETTCLSSVWITDETTKNYFTLHGRQNDFKTLEPGKVAYYDGMVKIELDKVESMIALPCHPSNAVTIRELKADPSKYLGSLDIDLTSKINSNGDITVDQGVIAGCAGGIYDNLCAAADILKGKSTGNGEFALSVYPASQPVFSAIIKNGVAQELITAGATMRTAFCGPCFGAGDVPANGGFSIRHSTRNFPNREGSKPSAGQSAAVALMDARSIAATAANGGILTAADTLDVEYRDYPYEFDDKVYKNRVYNGYGKPDVSYELVIGPNIADWPAQKPLSDDALLAIVSVIDDPVTTTDELIPSGETSSYRSNPLKLAEFALSRKDPGYVGRAKSVASNALPEFVVTALKTLPHSADCDTPELGSAIYANKPGDGSAREQAASCQRVLGGLANFAREYATKRYRSNLINWGMLPFTVKFADKNEELPFDVGDFVYVHDVRRAVENADAEKETSLNGYILKSDGVILDITLNLPPLTKDERDIILAGCLINYYRD